MFKKKIFSLIIINLNKNSLKNPNFQSDIIASHIQQIRRHNLFPQTVNTFRMKNLIRLVKTLKTKEILLIQQMYKSYFRETSKEHMGLVLFNCILKDKVQTNKDASQLICPDKHSSVVSQVKKKLENDILNIMLLSTICEPREQSTGKDFSCHKNLLLGKVLIERGLTQEAITILHTTSQQAEKAELHDIKINCDNMIHTIHHEDTYDITGITHKTSIGSSIESYSNILHARYINHPFMYGHSVYDPDVTRDFDADELMNKMHKTNSRKAVYWYNMGIIHYYIQQQDHLRAGKASIELLNKTAIRSEMPSAEERSEFYLQMSRIFMHLGDPFHAIHAAKYCINDMPAGISAASLPHQMLLRGYLLLKDMDAASEIVDKAFESLKTMASNYFSIWYLFRAGVLFLQKKYKEASQMLISHEQNFNTNISQKTFAMLFELVNILETGDMHWFDYKFESFRKRLQRYTLKDSDRIRYIYQMVSLVKRNNYQYNLERSSIADSFQKVTTIAWDPLGYEIIDLSDWIKSRIGLTLENTLA